jgi:hypothetical protein
MIKAIKTILIPSLIILLNSGFTIYKPGVVYSPLITNKNDLNVSASLGILGNGLINVQSAYSLTNHLGLIMNGMFHDYDYTGYIINGKVITIGDVEKYRINSVEAGAGYFNSFGKKNNKLFQLYGGLGAGAASDISLRSLKYEGYSNFYNVFLQIGCAHVGKYFESAFDLKANYVHIYNIRGTIPSYSDLARQLPYFSDSLKSNFINFEPVYTLKGGFSNLKGTFQFGFDFTRLYNTSQYYYDPISHQVSSNLLNVFKISIGISYTFRDAYVTRKE